MWPPLTYRTFLWEEHFSIDGQKSKHIATVINQSFVLWNDSSAGMSHAAWQLVHLTENVFD